jgi:predicted nucleic acid-binding protein
MQVLVDTPIWSLALRRSAEDLNPAEKKQNVALEELIRDGRAQLIGPVRQELLSGVPREATFARLRDYLRAFDEPILESADYEDAAHVDNRCRSRGIAPTNIDVLICAVALRRNWQVFTADQDFFRYAKIFPLTLFNF